MSNPDPIVAPEGDSFAVTFFDLTTGRVRSVFRGGSLGQVALNQPDGTFLIPGDHPFDSYAKDGAVRPLPPAPGRWAEWDLAAERWIDPRSVIQISADQQARRAATHMPKLAFCLALMDAGFLTPAEADLAVGGDVPAPFLAAVEGLSAETRDRARICWRGATVIERLDPLLAEVAGQRGISDATLDALFGLTEDTP